MFVTILVQDFKQSAQQGQQSGQLSGQRIMASPAQQGQQDGQQQGQPGEQPLGAGQLPVITQDSVLASVEEGQLDGVISWPSTAQSLGGPAWPATPGWERLVPRQGYEPGMDVGPDTAFSLVPVSSLGQLSAAAGEASLASLRGGPAAAAAIDDDQVSEAETVVVGPATCPHLGAGPAPLASSTFSQGPATGPLNGAWADYVPTGDLAGVHPPIALEVGPAAASSVILEGPAGPAQSFGPAAAEVIPPMPERHPPIPEDAPWAPTRRVTGWQVGVSSRAPPRQQRGPAERISDSPGQPLVRFEDPDPAFFPATEHDPVGGWKILVSDVNFDDVPLVTTSAGHLRPARSTD